MRGRRPEQARSETAVLRDQSRFQAGWGEAYSPGSRPDFIEIHARTVIGESTSGQAREIREIVSETGERFRATRRIRAAGAGVGRARLRPLNHIPPTPSPNESNEREPKAQADLLPWRTWKTRGHGRAPAEPL